MKSRFFEEKAVISSLHTVQNSLFVSFGRILIVDNDIQQFYPATTEKPLFVSFECILIVDNDIRQFYPATTGKNTFKE